MTIDANHAIQWTPDTIPADPQHVAVQVSDGRGGMDVFGWDVNVVSQHTDHPPTITSPPKTNATMGATYAYDLAASDPDGDLLGWSLDKAPFGMSIDRSSGKLRWTPTGDDVGLKDVIVRVKDFYGESDTQEFTLVVRGENLPPMINSDPPTTAITNQLYTYAVRATDPEGGPLSYSFANTPPTGMTIDPATGLVQWTPAADGGPYDVVIRVTDDQGATQDQPYKVTASSTQTDHPPVILSTPPGTALENHAYHTIIQASDPDSGDTLTYSLAEVPTPNGSDVGDLMQIDPSTGVIDWVPSHNQAVAGTQYATVVVTDSAGMKSSYRWAITVGPSNAGPQVTSTAVASVTAGLVYSYDIQATDPAGGLMHFALASGPAGMTVDAFGRVRWSTTVADVGKQNVDVTVSDDFGVSIEHTFTIDVQPDTQAPALDLEVSPNPADKNVTVTLLAMATDNVAVASLTMTVDGTQVALDVKGSARESFAAYGTHTIVATATDAAGNSTSQTQTLQIADTTNTSAPTLAITSPADQAVITAPTDVVGTVSDPSLRSYEPEAIPLDGSAPSHVLVNVLSTNGQPLSNITSATIGQFDPTMLANGAYDLRLTATNWGLDANNNYYSATLDQVVNVSGKLKLGNFSLSFTDLTVPVAGMPITITRSYDTLKAGQSGDFGYGWSLAVAQPKVDVDLSTTALALFGDLPAFADGTRVTVTKDDGTTEGFTFQPYQTSLDWLGLVTVWHPQFVPDAGVMDWLTVPDVQLDAVGDGTYIGDASGLSYNPADPTFGGTYTLTTPDGTASKIDAATNELLSETDRHGNQLSFGDGGITSNRGRAVTFERDQAGRITKIIDPRGNYYVSYQYDGSGNLVSFTDRTNNALPADQRHSTTYSYVGGSDYPHYLAQITDPLGRTTVTAAYNASDGRLSSITDAAGKTANLTYDTAALTQSASITRPDNSVETTTVGFDNWGNVIRQEDAAGQVTLRDYVNVNSVPTWLGSETQVVGTPGGGDDLVTTYGTTPSDFDAFGNPKVVTGPGGEKTYYGYNEAGQMTSQTQPTGETTNYGYAYGGYNEMGGSTATDLQFVEDPAGSTTAFKYDSHGNVTEIRTGIPFNNFSWYDMYYGGYYETYYDPNASSSDPAYQPTTRPEYPKTTFQYADVGDLVQTTDSSGNVSNAVHDALGDRELSYHWWSDPSDPTNTALYKTVVDRMKYDAEGRAANTMEYVLPGHVDFTAGSDLDSQTPLWTTATQYDSAGQTASTTDNLGNQTQTTYDKRGEVIQTRTETADATGATKWLVTRTVYDDKGQAVYATDQYVDPGDGTCPPGYGTYTEYDAVGRVIRTQRLKNMAIDITGTAPAEQSSLSATYPGTVVSSTQTHYDAAGRVDYTIDQYGSQTDNLYDAAGRQIESRTQVKDESGALQWLVTRTVYDADGRAVLTTDPYVDGVTTDITGTRTTYDDAGRAVQSQALEGVSVSIDTSGAYPSSSIASAGTVDWSSETVYNTQGQVSESVARHAPGVAGPKTDYEYGDAGRQTAQIGPAALDPLAGQTVRERSESKYNSDGSLKETWDNIRVVVDASGNVTSTDYTNKHVTAYQYDESGRTVKTTYVDNSSTETGYDAYGRTAWEEDAMGLVKSYSYDSQGRLAEVQLPAVPDPLNGDVLTQPTYQYAYDEFGNLVQILDPYSHETQFTFDAQGHQTTRTLPIGVSTTTDPNDFVEHEYYDDRGRLDHEVSFEGVVTAYVYDDGVGGGGRLVEKEFYPDLTAYNNGAGAPSEITQYTYDAYGRQTQIVQDTDGNLATTADQRVTVNAFDAFGHIVSVATPEGTVHYEYDAATGEHTRTWTGTDSAAPDTDTRYAYDALGRLDEVQAVARNRQAITPAEVTDYVYDLLGNLKQARLPNGVISEYQYDSLNRLTQLKEYRDANGNHTYDAAVDAALAEFDYNLLSDGKRSGVTETDDQGRTTQINWLYDPIGRLTGEAYDSFDATLDFIAKYRVDLAGNRVQKLTNTAPTSADFTAFLSNGALNPDETDTSTYDANDRLLTETDDAAGTANDRYTEYSYGASNSATQETGKTIHEGLTSSGTVLEQDTYGYNLQGRMSSATVDKTGSGGGVSNSGYQYDGSAIRVSQTVDGQKTDYLNDNFNPTGYSQVLEEKIAGIILKSYTLGLDIIAQQAPSIQSGGTLYLLKDGHGSTRGLVDALGLPLSGEVYRYDAFGNPIGFNPSNALTSHLYNGEMLDTSTGLYDFRARMYNPQTATFTTADPDIYGNAQDPLTLHKYVFCHGDPINGTDPTGHGELTEVLVTATIGATLGGMSAYYAGLGWKGMVGGALLGGVLGGFGGYAGLLAALKVGGESAAGIGVFFGTLNTVSEYVNTILKGIETANGGYDGTVALAHLRSKLITKWAGLSTAQKQRVISQIHTSLTAWDIADMAFDDKHRWTDGISGAAPFTLTYQGSVYPVADVNYVLWGLVNGLAYNDGIQTIWTDRQATRAQVYAYRSGFGGAGIFSEVYKWMLNGFEGPDPYLYQTMAGKAQWALYGWDWATDPAAAPPTEVAMPLAQPSPLPWTHGLRFRAGISNDIDTASW